MYLKILRSGDVLEVYEMDHAPINQFEKMKAERQQIFDSACEFLAAGQNVMAEIFIREYVATDPENIKEERRIERLFAGITEVDRKEARLAQTLRDARNNLRRLAINNFPNTKSTFVTLTIAENSDDIDYYDKKVKQFIRLLRKDYGQLHYIGVREFQKRGAIHYHLLIDYPFVKGLSKNQVQQTEVYFARKYWKQGFVDLMTIDHVDNVGAYISKYMTKDMHDKRLVGRKAYLCSQGLKRSEVLKFDTDALQMTLDKISSEDIDLASVFETMQQNQIDKIKSLELSLENAEKQKKEFKDEPEILANIERYIKDVTKEINSIKGLLYNPSYFEDSTLYNVYYVN